MKTLRDFLDLAIEQEIKAQKLYNHGASIATEQQSKDFLNRLEKEEIEHEKMLRNIRDTEMFDLSTPIENNRVFVVAAVSHGIEPDMDENLTLEQVWEIALQREHTARERYLNAAQSVEDKELVILLTNLANDEEQHHKVVDRQFKMQTGSMGEEF